MPKNSLVEAEEMELNDQNFSTSMHRQKPHHQVGARRQVKILYLFTYEC